MLLPRARRDPAEAARGHPPGSPRSALTGILRRPRDSPTGVGGYLCTQWPRCGRCGRRIFQRNCATSRCFSLCIEQGPVSLSARAAQRNEDGTSEISKKKTTNMARAVTGERNPAAHGGQGCGDKQCGRQGLDRRSGTGFAGAVPDQRAARVCTTPRRAFGLSTHLEGRACWPSAPRPTANTFDSGFSPHSRGALDARPSTEARQLAHSFPSSPGGHNRHEVLTVVAGITPINAMRLGTILLDNARHSCLSLAQAKRKQQAAVPDCCLSGLILSRSVWVMELPRTVVGSLRKPARTVARLLWPVSFGCFPQYPTSKSSL
jgi:hypothetical protein